MASNLFTNVPPAIPWAVIAVSLIAMAQFGSTERLAAALAWLIFVAVLLANGEQAFKKLAGLSGDTTTTGDKKKAG